MPTFVITRTDIVVEVTGTDRLSYLEDVTSQRLADRGARSFTRALELNANGAPVSAFDVVVLEDRLLLIAPTPGVATDLVERLGQRTFLSDASFTPTDLRVVSVRGDEVRSVAAEAGLTVERSAVEPRQGATVVVRDDGGVDVILQPDAADEVVETVTEAGAVVGDDAMLDAWHVASGEPRWGRELAPPHLPEELGLLPSHVHLAKGCYPGQEAVARMWMLGRPRRQLARVEVTGDVGPGWTAGEGRRKVEVTGTAAWDGERVGLAFVPSDTERGTRFGDEQAGVRIIELVGAGRPVPGHDPAVQRRRDKRGA